MEELDLGSSTKLKVKYNGQEYDLIKPKAKVLRELQRQVAKDGPAGEMDLTIQFLVDCGMPEDAALDMEVDAIVKLTEFLFAKKKT